MAAKSKKWKFTVEVPCREDCTNKLAKEKVQVAVAAAFSLADTDVKVAVVKPVIPMKASVKK